MAIKKDSLSVNQLLAGEERYDIRYDTICKNLTFKPKKNWQIAGVVYLTRSETKRNNGKKIKQTDEHN